MNIYLFAMLTLLLAVLGSLTGTAISHFLIRKFAGIGSAVVCFAMTALLGVGMPAILWWNTFKENGTVEGSHNSAILVPLCGVLGLTVALALASKGASDAAARIRTKD